MEPIQISLDDLVSGAEKAFENAERLYFEAGVLTKVEAIARALCLHQISLEECSKVHNLGAWAVSLVMGHEVDHKSALAAFRRHSSKNKSNAYLLEASEAEKEAKSRGDLKGTVEAFKETQRDFHEKSNNQKNASLYVDWIDGKFVSPSERITREMLAAISHRNAEFLSHAHVALETLKRLTKAPNKRRGLFRSFAEQAEKLREEKPDDPIDAIERLIWAFLDAEKSKLKE